MSYMVQKLVCICKNKVYILFSLLRYTKGKLFVVFFLQPEVIQNMTEFKRGLPLFPLVKPHINFMAAKLWRFPMSGKVQVDAFLSLPRARKTILATLIVSCSLLERHRGKKEKKKTCQMSLCRNIKNPE